MMAICVALAVVGLFHVIHGTSALRVTLIIAALCVAAFVVYEFLMRRSESKPKL